MHSNGRILSVLVAFGLSAISATASANTVKWVTLENFNSASVENITYLGQRATADVGPLSIEYTLNKSDGTQAHPVPVRVDAGRLAIDMRSLGGTTNYTYTIELAHPNYQSRDVLGVRWDMQVQGCAAAVQEKTNHRFSFDANLAESPLPNGQTTFPGNNHVKQRGRWEVDFIAPRRAGESTRIETRSLVDQDDSHPSVLDLRPIATANNDLRRSMQRYSMVFDQNWFKTETYSGSQILRFAKAQPADTGRAVRFSGSSRFRSGVPANTRCRISIENIQLRVRNP